MRIPVLAATVVVLLTSTLSPPGHAFLAEFRAHPLHVAAFNVRHFGRGFMDDAEIVSHLVKIMERYDIVLIQEVRDGTNTALDDLIKKLESGGNTWRYVASQPLGRTKIYKEQYVFFYKTKAATVLNIYQTKDTALDVYAREPFCVQFEFESSAKNTRESVVLLAIHTRPVATKLELQHLPATVKSVAKRFPSSIGVVVLGDMNADCRYLAEKWRTTLEIFNGPDFKSLIPHSADSTTKESTNCAYDRIILYGKAIVARDASVFNFQSWLKLDEGAALNVSDHHPVEFYLY